jgi:3-hexulose-6-phosphate synthase
MKLLIKYNFSEISEALRVAKQTAEFADILIVGSLLIFKNGVSAVQDFVSEFPGKEICADAKISDKGDEAAAMFVRYGAKHISVLDGTYHSTIRSAASAAQAGGAQVILDLINSNSLGQSVHDAKFLGVDSVLFHLENVPDGKISLGDDLRQACANSDLPVFIKGQINEELLESLLPIKPNGIVVGDTVTKSSDPVKEIKNIRDMIGKG